MCIRLLRDSHSEALAEEKLVACVSVCSVTAIVKEGFKVFLDGSQESPGHSRSFWLYFLLIYTLFIPSSKET